LRELVKRGLNCPAGGRAAINRYVQTHQLRGGDHHHKPGVYYCRDAFEGLPATIEALTTKSRRETFIEASP